MNSIKLKRGKEKAIYQKHPWIFSGAIEHVQGKTKNGEVVKVQSYTGEFLAYGYFNAQSRVSIRIIEWDEKTVINSAWYYQKIQHAIHARKGHINLEETNTYRLIFSEADYLPGLIVDKYADYLSVQILSTGILNAKEDIINALKEIVNPKGIFDRSDLTALTHEGLTINNGLLWGENPPEFLEVKENGINYLVNISAGQKSGFYCDQRDNRHILAQYVKDKNVLDCFSYSGGFTLNALKNGAAHVTSVDSSALAIETLEKNITLNGFDTNQTQAIQSDVNKQLREFKDQNTKFDVIILDPPKYAPSKSALDRAARAYKDLNRLAMHLLNEGGLLATFSCSGAVDLETFKQILAWAALDAGKEVQVIYQFCQPIDHPIRLSFPEGEYLKGLLIRVS